MLRMIPLQHVFIAHMHVEMAKLAKIERNENKWRICMHIAHYNNNLSVVPLFYLLAYYKYTTATSNTILQ